MADSSSARRSAGAASKSRQSAKSGDSSKKLLGIFVMLICCAGVGYFVWTNLRIISENSDQIEAARQPQPPDSADEAEKKQIAESEEGMQNMVKAASQAMQTAERAEAIHREPLDLPISLVRSVSPAAVTNPGEIIAEPEPPQVTVTAVMITDNERVALVNVDGEEGIVMRQGHKFAEGKARLTKIDAKGVTFIWMRKSYHISL